MRAHTMVTVLTCLALVGMLGIHAPTAWAQSLPPVSAGQRIRVWTDAAEAIIGTVAMIDVAAIHIDRRANDRATVPMSAIRRVEVSRIATSKSEGAKKGALRGAIIGAAIGAVTLGLQHDAVGDDGSSAGKAAALGAWSGGLFGGLIGAGIGAARAGEKWDAVWP